MISKLKILIVFKHVASSSIKKENVNYVNKQQKEGTKECWNTSMHRDFFYYMPKSQNHSRLARGIYVWLDLRGRSENINIQHRFQLIFYKNLMKCLKLRELVTQIYVIVCHNSVSGQPLYIIYLLYWGDSIDFKLVVSNPRFFNDIHLSTSPQANKDY